MKKKIKAIETKYKGYRFRSRLEARWAVFFDALELKWEYEPEGFDLGDGVYYLPDFYLPEMKVWIEIKGGFATDEEIYKCRKLFSLLTGKSETTDLLVTGDVKFVRFMLDFVETFVKERDKVDSVSLETMQYEIDFMLNQVQKRTYVVCFDEGLDGNCWFCGDELIMSFSLFDFFTTNMHGLTVMKNNKLLGEKYTGAVNMYSKISSALTKAKSARFEHGECG